jgi:hypothetical protein
VGLTVLGPLAVQFATAGKIQVDIVQCAILGATLTIKAAMLPAGMILTFPRGLWLQAGAVWAAAIIGVTIGLWGSASLGATAPLLGLLAAITFGEAIPIIAAAMVFLRRREHSHA